MAPLELLEEEEEEGAMARGEEEARVETRVDKEKKKKKKIPPSTVIFYVASYYVMFLYSSMVLRNTYVRTVLYVRNSEKPRLTTSCHIFSLNLLNSGRSPYPLPGSSGPPDRGLPLAGHRALLPGGPPGGGRPRAVPHTRQVVQVSLIVLVFQPSLP